LGNTTAYSYAAQVQDVFTFYNETGISYPDGTSEAFTYDVTGNVLTHTAQDGSVTTFTYNANGELLTTTDAKKGVTTFTWNQDWTIATQTDPLGNLVAYGYDSLKRLVKVTDPNGGISTFGYSIAGDGSHVTFGQAAGLGSTTQYYDFNGQPQDRVNELAGVYHATYTNTENISTLTDPLGNKTTWTYNKADQVSSVTDQTFLAVGFNYDSAGHLTSMDNPAGTLATFGYTPEGRISSTTDGTGNKTSFTYDALGRETGVTTPTGSKISLGYDKLGNMISTTDPLGVVQTRTLDALGRTTQVNMTGGLTTSITRDVLGYPTALITANGNKWTSQFDAVGRIANLIDPLGNSTNYVYTGTQLTQIKTPMGVEALVTDKAGHVTKRAYADGTVINTGYDPSGRIISADNVTVKRDLKGQPTNVNGIGITFDGTGRPATLTYASGKAITYAYNLSGNVSSIVDWVGGKTSFSYDGAGRLTTMTYPSGATNTYTYDANALLTKIGFGSLGSITLTRDAAGKIIAADRSVPLAPSVAGTSSVQLSYDAAAQLTGATYDALGRVTAQSGRTYTWNLASQLTAFVDGSNSPTFTYDGLGTINTMITGSTTRSFVYNYLLPYPALSIVRQGGSDLRYYVYTPDGLLLYSIEADNSRLFYHFDEMGNTVMLSNGSGALSDGYAITPYGEIASHAGTADNPFTWQGQYGVFQEGTALFNVRNRHYDASTARFISRDPLMSADPRSSEPYAYANGNPLLYTDPFGTSSTTNKCKPSTAVIIAVAANGVQGISPLEVSNFITCEISNGYIKTGNLIVDGLIDELNGDVQSNHSISWKHLATVMQVDNNDPQPIYDLLNGLIKAAIAKANTPVKAPVAVVTPAPTPPQPVNPPEPCTAKPTPTVVKPLLPIATVPAAAGAAQETAAEIAKICASSRSPSTCEATSGALSSLLAGSYLGTN
jgi:RHS repeat-associated protein